MNPKEGVTSSETTVDKFSFLQDLFLILFYVILVLDTQLQEIDITRTKLAENERLYWYIY